MMYSEPICCAFTYDIYGWGTLHTRTAVGVVCDWPDLRNIFSRQGPPCQAINARHFRTISKLGPKLFAISLANLKVFYHDGYQWRQYRTARHVRLGTLEDFTELLHDEDNTDNDEDWSQDDNDGKDRDDDPGRQSKDSTSTNNSTYQINQAILYYCLLRMLLILELENVFLQCQSFIR